MNNEQKKFPPVQTAWQALVKVILYFLSHLPAAIKHPNKSSALKESKIKGMAARETKKGTY